MHTPPVQSVGASQYIFILLQACPAPTNVGVTHPPLKQYETGPLKDAQSLFVVHVRGIWHVSPLHTLDGAQSLVEEHPPKKVDLHTLLVQIVPLGHEPTAEVQGPVPIWGLQVPKSHVKPTAQGVDVHDAPLAAVVVVVVVEVVFLVKYNTSKIIAIIARTAAKIIKNINKPFFGLGGGGGSGHTWATARLSILLGNSNGSFISDRLDILMGCYYPIMLFFIDWYHKEEIGRLFIIP